MCVVVVVVVVTAARDAHGSHAVLHAGHVLVVGPVRCRRRVLRPVITEGERRRVVSEMMFTNKRSMRESAPRGGWFGRRVPFRNTAAFRSARAARRLESRQRGLLIVHHVEARAVSDERAPRELCEILLNVRSLSVSVLVSQTRESLPLSSHTTRRYARIHRRDIRHRVRVPSRGRRRGRVEAPRSVGAPPKMPRRTHRGTHAPPTNSPPSVAANLIMHAPVCIPD